MSEKRGYIKLSWQGIHDEYLIEYSTDGQNWLYLATVKATTYTHTNLDPDVLYYYRVWGVKNGIKSSVPAQISGYAKDTTPPPVPTNISITPIINGFTITIEAPSASDWDGFEIHASTNSGFTPSSSTLKAKGKASTFNVQDLSGGTTYYVKVISYDTSGNKSNPSTEYSVVPKKVGDSDVDTQPPAVPTGLSLQTYLEEIDAPQYGKYNAVIKATWNAVSDSDLEGYQVRIRKTTESDYTVVSTKDTYYLFRELKAGTSFGVQVRAYDRFGNYSNWCTEAQITTAGDSTPPSVPSSINATAYFKTIVVRWNEVTDPDLAGYELYASTSPNFTPSPSNLIYVGKSNSYSFSADVNQTWYFKVRSYDTSGNYSNYSVETSASTAQIQTADIAVNSIASNLIQAGAITTDHLSAYCVTGEKIASDSIETKHIKANSITVNLLSFDTQLLSFATSFEDDTNGDGIPDGFSAECYGGSVSLDTTNYWRGKQSVKLSVNEGSGSYYAQLILNSYIPVTNYELPLMIYYVAKKTSGIGVLQLLVKQFDNNKNEIPNSTMIIDLAESDTTEWADGIVTLNTGPFLFNNSTQYIKISFRIFSYSPFPATTFHLDFIKIYPLQITTANMTTISQGNIFIVKPIARNLWTDTQTYSLSYNTPYEFKTVKIYECQDMQFKKYMQIRFQVYYPCSLSTRVIIHRYFWQGRVKSDWPYYSSASNFSGGAWRDVVYNFTQPYPSSLDTMRIEVQCMSGCGSATFSVRNFYCDGGSWTYVL